ncbi:MAG: glycosyltransferase [Firmicutes bacterium]|nr:glycosyltransferase [Bacillota bacterium]
MQPLISVIMAVYNTEMTLKKAVQSILSQNFDDWELLLVNDGSTDSCPQIIDDYVKSDNRIRVFHKENEGAYSCFNVAIEKATGKYITFLDSDDTLELDALKIVAEQAAEHYYDIIFMCVNIFECDENQNIIKLEHKDVLPSSLEKNLPITSKNEVEKLWIILFYANLISNVKNVYKSTLIKKYKFRKLLYGEDRFLNLDLADDVHSASCHPKPIHNHFLYISNDTYNISRKYHSNAFAMFSEYYTKSKQLFAKWNCLDERRLYILSENMTTVNLPEVLKQIFSPNNKNTPEENIDIVVNYYNDIIFETAAISDNLDKVDNQIFNTIGNIILNNEISADFDNPVFRLFTAINNTTISVDEIKQEIINSLLDYRNPYRIGFEVYKTLSVQFIQIANAELLDYLQTEQIARKLLFTGNFEQALDTVIQLFNSKISTPEQYIILALCGYHLGLTEYAQNAVETGLQLFPNYPRLEELQNIINTERNE